MYRTEGWGALTVTEQQWTVLDEALNPELYAAWRTEQHAQTATAVSTKGGIGNGSTAQTTDTTAGNPRKAARRGLKRCVACNGHLVRSEDANLHLALIPVAKHVHRRAQWV